MNALIAHIRTQRFTYIVLPFTFLLTWLVIKATNGMTGRESNEDVGALVSYFLAAVKCVIAIELAVLVKTHADINRAASIDGTPEITSNMELFISRAQTVALIWLFLHAIEPR